MITVAETTKWVGNIPNHKYILSDDRRWMFGYIKKGDRLPTLFNNPQKFDPRGRSFVVIVKTKDNDDTVQTWSVTGSRGDTYTVVARRGEYTCTCPASLFRRTECKHIIEIKNRTAHDTNTNQSKNSEGD